MERLYAATRKGLLTFEHSAGAWKQTGQSFLGDPVTAVLPDKRDGALYAALNLGHFGIKLHRSDDRGKTWQELTPPAFPATSNGDESSDAKAPSVSLIWTLVGGGADRPGLLWAGTLPGGLFRSEDRGETWSLVESLWNEPARKNWMGGGYDEPGIHSICIDPRDSRKVTLGISTGGVWRSDDGGESWRQAGAGMRNEYMPPEQARDPAVQDVHRLAQCPSAPDVVWCQHHNGIFLSRDGGDTFEEITAAQPSRFGFAVVVHPSDPETAWFAPAIKDECRIPVDQRMVVSRTRNGGAGFEVFGNGLPSPSYDLVYRHGLAIDGTGKQLVMGSTTGGLWVGDTAGEQWTTVSSHLPPINQVVWSA
ncbi:MAG: sialidase family protein [Rhodospirillales bacterium]